MPLPAVEIPSTRRSRLRLDAFRRILGRISARNEAPQNFRGGAVGFNVESAGEFRRNGFAAVILAEAKKTPRRR
jgi:hypothetical protein